MNNFESSARRGVGYPLAEACQKLGNVGQKNIWKECVLSLEFPKLGRDQYDYQSRILFRLQETGSDRSMIGQRIVGELQKYDDIFEKIELSGNGFLNIRLKKSHIIKELNHLLASEILPIPGPAIKEGGYPEKYNIEFVSANPTGPLHVGHGRWAVIGDTLARLLRAAHHDVETEFYVNNIGNQIELLEASIRAAQNELPVPEGGYGGAYITTIAKKLHPGESTALHILDDQKKTLRDLKVEFNRYYLEEELHRSGEIEKTIRRFEKSGKVYRKDDAEWFRSTDFGDDKDRVLRRADGRVTYFAADVAYHMQKFSRGYTHLLNIWGADQNKAELKSLNIKIGQLVSLTRKGAPIRMSKRSGDIITIDEVREEVGIDAVRFLLLQTRPESHLQFDLELAK